MTRSEIAVYRRDTGELLHLAPRALAPVGDDALATLALPDSYSSDTFEWSPATRRFSESPAKVDALLLAEVKREAERRKMLVMSPGGAKKAEYAEKRAEVNFWDTLGGSVNAILAVVNALPPAQRAIKFAWATADAAAFGDTIDKAIARFRAGITNSATVMTIAATEARACADIKAARTLTAKRAAAASVAWPT